MIRTEPLVAFKPGTELLLYPYSAEEFILAEQRGYKVLEQSEQAWVIYNRDKLLCYAGVIRTSLLSIPFLWLLLGGGLSRFDARVFRKLTKLLSTYYPVTQLVVEDDFVIGKRFAQFCGAVPLDLFIEFGDRRFQYFEVQ